MPETSPRARAGLVGIAGCALVCAGYAAAGHARATAPVARPAMLAGVSASLEKEFASGAELFDHVWTPGEGLGPFLNAQSCAACHAHPRSGGTSRTADGFVLVSPEVTDPSGGRVFQMLRLRPDRPTTSRPLPRQVARRKPPPLFGLGLLEAALQPSRTGGQAEGRRGRFGWKNGFETIDAAVAAAFANELGVLGADLVNGGTAEISRRQLAQVSQFVRLLAPPAPRRVEETTAGRRVFDAVGCASCHRPTLRTGESSIAALRHRTFEPYTDLALHDLGTELSDGFDDRGVRGSEFRTPPLWGLGESGPPYLHDNRADTIERAIELHGGEAEAVAAAYRGLSPADRRQLLRFLRSL